MSLLTKFSKVQIDHSKSILRGEDLEFCTNLETQYFSAFRFYEIKFEFILINTEDNEFLNFDGMREDVQTSIDSLNKSFIQMIVYHFTDKYKITLKSEDIQSKIFPETEKSRRWVEPEDRVITLSYLENKKISLNSIMTHIQDELGGLTLDEKAETEIKDKFYDDFCKRYHRDRLDLVKNRVEFEHTYFSFDYGWSSDGSLKFNYNCDEKVKEIC